MWHDSFMSAARRNHGRAMTDWCVSYDKLLRVTWLNHMCEMTHSFVCHVLFVFQTWYFHICDRTRSYMWHNLFACVTWPVHMCDISLSYMWDESYRKWGRKSAAASNENGCLRAPTISRVTYKNDICHTFESFMSNMSQRNKRHITMAPSMSHIYEAATRMDVYARLQSVVSHIKWGMSHIWSHTYSWGSHENGCSCMPAMSHVTPKWVMSHMDGSRHTKMSHVTHKWVMSHKSESCHIWVGNVTQKRVMPYMWNCTQERDMSYMNRQFHIYQSVVPHRNASCHTYECGSIERECLCAPRMSHVLYESVMIHTNESCVTYTWGSIERNWICMCT